jgi:hypothetical protein
MRGLRKGAVAATNVSCPNADQSWDDGLLQATHAIAESAQGMRMAAWGFWEWLAYGGIAIDAAMLALDQGIRRSSTPPEGSITQSSIWAFTPFALILLSAAIFLFRLLSPPIPETKRPETAGAPVPALSQPPAAPVATPVPAPSLAVAAPSSTQDELGFVLPGQLDEETNQDIRQLIYTFNQRLHDLELEYIRNKDKLTGSVDKIALATLELDEKLNRDFRQKYETDFLHLDSELARRLKINDTRDGSIPPGRVGLERVGILGGHLMNLANQLP